MSSVGIILGSGWGKISHHFKAKKIQDFSTVFGHTPTALGHEGKILSGTLHGKRVILLSGRFHLYEGYSPEEAAKTVTYLHEQGISKLILTSAAGALNPKFKVGDLVIHSDVLTLFCPSPLVGSHFQDMSEPYAKHMVEQTEICAHKTGLDYQKGVYAFVRGPHYESFADKLALRQLGADIVGSSTVPELIMAKHLQMDVLGLSITTNLAFVKHSHQEVLKAAEHKEDILFLLLDRLIKVL